MFDHVEAFHRPRSIPEAVRLLRAGGSSARLIAGGTDVVVKADPGIRVLVDVTQLGLSYIRRESGAWAIGATTTMASLEANPGIQALAGGILAQAAAACGSVQVRNMATLGGNLANASPAADTATPLLVLDASVTIAGPRARRTIALADFFTGAGKTTLGKDLLVEVVIPAAPCGRAGWSFQKLGRTESDISLVNVAGGLQIGAKGVVKWARLALGAVAPTPARAHRAEELLAGQKLTAELIDRVCDEAAREIHPRSDLRASAEYRLEVSRVLVRRALEQCAERVGCAL